MKKFKEFYIEQKYWGKESKLHIITGPYAAGKTTFKQKLIKKLKTTFVREYPSTVDVNESKWWEDLVDYAERNDTKVIETHMDYKGREPGEGIKIGKVVKPPSYIKIYVVLPKLKIIFKRQQMRDEYTYIEDTKEDYDWYKGILKQMNATQVK